MMTGTKKSKSTHYVDNKKFLSAMIEFKELYNIAEKNKEEYPPVSDYIGECFLKIATHLSYRPNFINYTYRDDMISDGIENCLQYVHNFNPEKSNNPFAYFTQIIYYAFLRRIAKEKKQTHVKNKIIQNTNYQSWTTMEGDDSAYTVLGFDPNVMLPDEDVYKPKKKSSEKTKGLESFMEEDKKKSNRKRNKKV
jgi:DNA-directed RNA polymerase specialized sigma24 family protein